MLASLGIVDLWTYVLGTLLVVLLPGPNSMFVLASAARRGVAAGYSAAAAVFVGDTLLMLAAALGVASLLKAEPMLFTGLKYLGAAYLCYIGIGMLRGAWRQWRRPADEPVQPEHNLARPFRRALLLRSCSSCPSSSSSSTRPTRTRGCRSWCWARSCKSSVSAT